MASASTCPTHIVIHYHRERRDYDNWRLTVSSNSVSKTLRQAIPNCLTAFGALFRCPISDLQSEALLLPTHLTRPSDSPPRSLDLSVLKPTTPDLHVFISDTIPGAHPDISPFGFTAITASINNPLAWIHVVNDDQSCEVFPATSPYRHSEKPPFFLVNASPKQDIHVTLIEPSKTHEQKTFTAPLSAYISLSEPALREDELNFTQLLSDQANFRRALSPVLTTGEPLQLSTSNPCKAEAKNPRILIVYCHRLDRSTLFTTLHPTLRAASTRALPIKRTDPYHSACVFEIDITYISESALENGIEFNVSPPLNGSNPILWKPRHGDSVIIADTYDEPIHTEDVDVTVYYHRFGGVPDWKDWELHVWTEATDKYAACSTMVKPSRVQGDTCVAFHLVGHIFPSGETVKAECVRMAEYPAEPVFGELVDASAKPRRDADKRDVIREWTAAHPPAQRMHFVQGDTKIHCQSPEKQLLQRVRRFRLRYRRYLGDDYEGWELYTWDNRDPHSHRVVVPQVETNRGWADFVIDRASYGAGNEISVAIRKGEWDETDDGIRVWKAHMMTSTLDEKDVGGTVTSGEEESFIIAQGTDLVLRSLEETKPMLKAYAIKNAIVLSTPVPVTWITPPQKGRPQPIVDTVCLFCPGDASKALRRRNEQSENGTGIGGRMLRFRKVKQDSPTEARLLFDEREHVLNEDFLVENVLVNVPGFDPVALTWQIHEDWDKYLYPGSLGWDYTPEQCMFRCFSPTADGVNVVLYNTPTGKTGRRVLPMRKIPHGCWKLTVDEDLKGKYYKLLAEGENKRLFPGVEVIDPYSRCNTSHTGRGLIFGEENTKICPRPDIKPSQTIVYELHIRDVTIDEASGISNGGKFMGLAEGGTRMTSLDEHVKPALTKWNPEPLQDVQKEFRFLDKFSTGLDHIAQMGVNTIQLLPVQDFDNDENNDKAYGWGYMPVHFNSPDGWYASRTETVARVTEFKKLVNAIHEAGMKVIMDVVYNHTAEDSNEFNLEARFSFNGVAPRYYYRTCGNTPVAHSGDSTCGMRKPHEPRCGECYSNGSGCGNEFRSEAPMGRKFIIDSLKYWVNEYQVDGFRFDLLGLIDVETLETAAAELKNIDPNIMIYGEPWCGGLTPIRMTEKGAQRSKGFGVFNNTFRDAIRGSPFGVEETFVMDGGRLTEVKGGIIGSIDDFADMPLESINYVECHDNYTLWDHMRFYIRSRTDEIRFTEEDMRRMNRLAAVLVFTSQGVPFMQAGQEMCRTKFDVENSYNSPDDINMVQWSGKAKEWATVQFYRGLILLRRSHPEIFCLETSEEVHERIIFYEDLGIPVAQRCIAYRITGSPNDLIPRLRERNEEMRDEFLRDEAERWSEVVLLFNPTPSSIVFQLPGISSDTIWFQVVNASSAGVRNVGGPFVGSVSVPGRSASILRKASAKDAEQSQLTLRLASISDSYCSFHGDDPLSKYAVGLNPHPVLEELRQSADLREKRKIFEQRRSTDPESRIFIPSRQMTEANALAALNKKYRKTDRVH